MSSSYLDDLLSAITCAEGLLSRLDELHGMASEPSLLGARLGTKSREIRKEAGAAIRDLSEGASFVEGTYPVEAEHAGTLVASLERRSERLYDRTRLHGDLDLGTEIESVVGLNSRTTIFEPHSQTVEILTLIQSS